MSKKCKTFLRVAAFCVVFGLLFYVVDTTLKFKYDDGIRPIMDFYHYPDDSIDVVFLGSSHVGVNVDTTQLCNEYGIASYKLWGSTQPIWNSWFYLVEAFKTQTPKVVVLETLALTHDIEYSDYSTSIKNTLGLKWSLNKLNAIRVSVLPEYREDAYFSFSTYHTRYTELETVDFTSYAWNYQFADKNNSDWYAVYAAGEPSHTTETLPIGDKEMIYFQKIVRLCKENDVPLVLLSSPYSIPDEERARLNTVKAYAEENDILYMDYISDPSSIGIDFLTDFGDSAGHLNSYGVAKLTSAIGDFLTENFTLPERYNDPYFAYAIPSDALYYMTDPFEGDGETAFLDTNLRLYDDPDDSWTLLAQIDTTCDTNEKIYFSCFDESSDYRGLLVRKAEDGQLDVIMGSNYYCKITLPDEPSVTLAIVKDGSNYTIYLDGEVVETNINTTCEAYSGSLTVGCQRLPDGRIGKLSGVNVQALEVREGALTEKKIQTWSEKHTYQLTTEEVTEQLFANFSGQLDYTLDSPFQGNGEETANTGVQLYADPQRDWTLLTELKLPADENEGGVYLSCFSEDSTDYRGLLIRKTEESLQILVGSGQMFTWLLPDADSIRLAIVKKGDLYTVYADGMLLGTLESACNAYAGELVLGGELDVDYEPFRFSTLGVQRLEIREESVDTTEILLW